MDVKTYASFIKKNFDNNGKKYLAKIALPINKQNPSAQKTSDRNFNEFQFDKKTFDLQGYGNTNYSASLEDNSELPKWINFLPTQRKFIINNDLKGDIEEINVKVTAKNINTSVDDTFTFIVDPEIRRIRLAKPQMMKDILVAAKLEKWNEIEILKLRSAKFEKERKIKEAKKLEAERLAKIEEAKRLEKERLAKIEAEKLAKIEERKDWKLKDLQKLKKRKDWKQKDSQKLKLRN